eukprot:scaffold285920_cov14-Prasinocladus_malaysianus.AAC.1
MGILVLVLIFPLVRLLRVLQSPGMRHAEIWSAAADGDADMLLCCAFSSKGRLHLLIAISQAIIPSS